MKKRSSPQKLIRRLAKPLTLSNKSLFLVFLVSILACAFLIGNIINSFFTLAGLVLSAALISSFLLFSKPGIIAPFKEIFLEKSCLYSLALLTSLIAFSFLPYILLWQESMETLAVFALCFLPSVAVFFFSLFLYSDIFRKKKSRPRLILSSSVFLSLVSTAIVLFMVSIGMTITYSGSQRAYTEVSNLIISELDRIHKEDYDYLPVLPVVSEIKTCHESLLQVSANKRENILSGATGQKFCFTDKCFEAIAEQSLHQKELLLFLGVINMTLTEVQRELNHLHSEQYLNNFSSLEEYASYLSKNHSAYLPPQNNINSGGDSTLMNASSPFQKSLSYAFSRTGMAREKERMALQETMLIEQNQGYRHIASHLLENLGEKEPPESRIIRLKILLLSSPK